jgi:hypothetical protein
MAGISFPFPASKDATATVGEIKLIELVSVYGDFDCTTTTVPTSTTDDASASGATDTATRRNELNGIMDAITDAERKRLTP